MKEYFSHDYSTRLDDKIKKLIRKHGMLGYGSYWAIVEDLYNNANALRLDYDCIAFDLRVGEDIVKSIINDFDLFVIDGDSFGSISVGRRIEERNDKSKKARESALSRWSKKKDDANAMRTQCDSNAIKGKEIKEKKYIYTQFYDSQLENCDNEKYRQFVKYMFGDNMLKQKLNGVLSIKNQLTVSEFEKVMAKCTANKKKLGDIVTKIENDKKYYKGKTSLYRTLLNWAEDRFAK
jgi:hypothetical protein